MPENIHSQPSPEEFASPLDSSDNHADLERDQDTSSALEADQAATETSEQPATDRKADRKAQAKSEALGFYDALIENARKADVPGIAEALADLEADKNIREQAIENGLESLFEAKESTIKQVLLRVSRFYAW